MELEQQYKPTTDETKLIILGTSINSRGKERKVLEMLNNIEEIEDLSIDMEDWERVLRITCRKPISIKLVMKNLEILGIVCYELTDS